MNFFNMLTNQKNTNKNLNNITEKNSNYFPDYPENIFTNEFSNEIKDEKNYKIQENYVNRNNYNEKYLKNNNTNFPNNYQNNSNNQNPYNVGDTDKNQNKGLFGNLNIQSLLPLLMGGKTNIPEMLTNYNPQLASIMNILNVKNKNKAAQTKTIKQKNDTSFDMSNFVKVKDYFEKK